MTLAIRTKSEILDLLMHRGQATAQELAAALEISPQAIRRHLKDLEADTLIHYQVHQAGVGRPQNVYELTELGRARLRTFTPTASPPHEFAVELLETLTESLGPTTLEAVLTAQWQRKAIYYRENLGNDSLAQRLEHLVALRHAEGYTAEFFPIAADSNATEQPPGFVLTEYNCAIANVAKSFPAVCDHELAMFAAALPDCHVERTHWLVNGEHRCGYLIRPNPMESGY